MSELIPYEILINGEVMWVVGSLGERSEYLRHHPEKAPKDLGLIAIALFRQETYVDYAAIGKVDDLRDDITWFRSHETYEWIDWMAGFAYRDQERQEQLKDTERNLGKFITSYGFAPDVVLETAPSEEEMQGYINHVVSKDVIDGQLVIPEEGEVDGA